MKKKVSRSIHASPSGSVGSGPGGGRRSTRDRAAALRGALVTWILHDRWQSSVDVPAPGMVERAVRRGLGPGGGAATECWSVAELLFALWDDTTPFPTCVADLLHLGGDTTFGDVARLVHDRHDDGRNGRHGDAVEELLSRRPASAATRGG